MGTTEACAGCTSNLKEGRGYPQRKGGGGDGSFPGAGIEMVGNHQESGGQCQVASQEGGTILGTFEEAGISRGPLKKT